MQRIRCEEQIHTDVAAPYPDQRTLVEPDPPKSEANLGASLRPSVRPSAEAVHFAVPQQANGIIEGSRSPLTHSRLGAGFS